MLTHSPFVLPRRASRWAGLVAVAAAAVVVLGAGWLATARADIIVVNGRLAAHASVVKTVAGGPSVAPAAAPEAPADPAAGPGGSVEGGCDRGACRPTDDGADEAGEDGAETMTVALDDLDTVPEGWLCVPLGGGLELCAPEDDAETLSAFGPLPDEPVEVDPTAAGQGAAAGCAGGGVPPTGAALGLAFLLLLVVLRRR